MGVFEGLLGGFTGRKREIETENLRQSELASQREQQIFSALLSSGDPELQTMALTGLLESAKPSRRKSGLKGWMGEMESSPFLPRIQQLIQTPVTTKETIPGVPETPTGHVSQELLPGTVQPMVTTPPPAVGSASQAPSSAVQGGPPPVPTGYQAQPFTQGPPMVLTSQRPRQVFRTPEEETYQKEIGQVRAEVEGDKMRVAAGLQPRYGARAGAVGSTFAEGEITPDVTSPTGYSQVLYLRSDPRQQQRIPAMPRTALSSRAVNSREQVAAELFGKPNEDPRQVMTRLSPEQLGQLDTTLRAREVSQAGAVTGARGAAENISKMNAPLSPDVAASQAVPFGTTMADLQGIVPVTEDQRKRRDAAVALAPQIDEIKQLIPQVFPAGAGLRGALKASEVIAAKRAARDPTMALLDEKIALAVGNISRVLAAETGRLTEQDVIRAQKALVDLQGWTDTQESALVKLQDVEGALRRIRTDMQTPGDVLKGRAAGGGPPAPNQTVPGLFVGSDGQLHTGSVDGPIYQPGK